MNQEQKELLISLENLWRMYPTLEFGKLLSILIVENNINNPLFYTTTQDWINKINLIREDVLKIKMQYE
jgi:hypothetical protein